MLDSIKTKATTCRNYYKNNPVRIKFVDSTVSLLDSALHRPSPLRNNQIIHLHTKAARRHSPSDVTECHHPRTSVHPQSARISVCVGAGVEKWPRKIESHTIRGVGAKHQSFRLCVSFSLGWAPAFQMVQRLADVRKTSNRVV